MFDDSHRAARYLTNFLGVIALTMLVVPATGVAKEGGKDLDAVLGEIEWGDSKKKVLKKIKAQMFTKMRQRKDLKHDRVKMQEARKRLVDKYKRIEESYTPLSGEKTGYEVSVISGEYTKNHGEALIKIDDKAAQRFFFFVDGELYKMVVAYRDNYLSGVGFKAFVGKVSGKYGRPDGTNYKEIAGEETLARATWKDPTTILHAKNKEEFFGTFVMVFSDRKRIQKMRANNEDFGGSNKDDGDVSGRVENLKKDSGKDENADVVDGMIGEKVEVDLSTEQSLDEQGPAGNKEKYKDKDGEQSSGSKQVADKGDDDADQQKQQEDESKDRDFSDLSAESDKEKKEEDDELIVY